MSSLSIPFTIKRIDAIAPPATGRATYRDTEVQGLELRVTAAGARTFTFLARVAGSGRRERVTIGRYPVILPEEARRKARTIAGTLAGGSSVADKRRAKREELTLAELFNEYMTTVAADYKRPENLRNIWRLYLAERWGARKLSEIKPVAVATWHRELPAAVLRRQRDAGRSRRGTGAVVANKALKLMHALYRWAIEVARLYSGDNPAHGHRYFKEANRNRFVQSDELPVFFRALADEPNDTIRDFFMLALLTGARRSNVLAMQWAEVNLDRAEWVIPDTKNGHPQTVTLAPEAVELLRQRWTARNPKAPGAAYVLPSHSAAGHLTEPKAGWARLKARMQALRVVDAIGATEGWDEAAMAAARQAVAADAVDWIAAHADAAQRHGIDVAALAVPDLRLHDLRRTLGSWQARTGASLLMIGKTLGHRSQQSTAIYARLDTDPVRQSVDRATAAIFAAAGRIEGAEVVPLRRKAG